jgi:hypothetical protein
LRPLFLFVVFSILFFFLFPWAHAEEHEAAFTPWSGYWWPFTHGGLATGLDYRGHPAPLEKYELLTQGSYPGELVSWYKEKYYDEEAPSWYGLCGYWARAACYEQIEILPSSEDNIIFRVGDKKGLLTLAHNDDVTETADGSSPDVFHYWLLNYIKDQGNAFVADLDADEEVWSYPIYRYEMESQINGDTESVTVRVYYANDLVDPDYMGTDVLSSAYTYDLFLEDGSIIGGEWTGGSIDDHPEKLTFPLTAVTSCEYLDYEEVLRLAGSQDDFLEKPGEVVEISPGTYNLILLDEDSYRIDCLAGNTVSILVEKQDGSYEDMIVIVTDGSGDEVESSVVDDDESMSLVTTAGNPPYTVTLMQTDYSDPNIYTLKVDLVRTYHQNVPYIPKNGMWSGFALTNPNDIEVIGVTLTTYTEDGQPLHTLLGPLNMAPGEKRLFFFDDLPWRRHEYSDIDKLTLMSDSRVSLLNLFGNSDDSLACFVQGRARGSHLIIPDTVPPMTPGQTMFGGVENESFEEITVLLNLYSMEGTLRNEISELICPKGTFSIEPGIDPFYSMPDSGWIEVIGAPGLDLSGYRYLSSSGRVESLFALPVGSSEKIVPHITPPGYWITTVTLINPNNVENRVNFHLRLAGEDSTNDMTIELTPLEKRTLELQDDFGKVEGDDLYHSILEIAGEYPLVGYYTFSTSDAEDDASFPLLDEMDFQDELILPHNTGHGADFWWTGFGICNPIGAAETVRIDPYDYDGNLMEDIVSRLLLEPGAYEVMDVQSLSAERFSEISWIKFSVEEPQGGLIGGFYLYGNKSEESPNTMLSGANM